MGTPPRESRHPEPPVERPGFPDGFLEDQIERKLRQFYARRREPVLRQTEPPPAAIEETVAAELACQTASEGLLD